MLATCVAGLIEKQAVFLAPRTEGSTGVLIAGAAAGIFIPGAGLATLAGTSLYGEHLQERLREQGDRVGLELLAEAGVSPRVAPHAYELAEAKHGQLKPNASISAHASYLYRALAERDRRALASAPSLASTENPRAAAAGIQ